MNDYQKFFKQRNNVLSGRRAKGAKRSKSLKSNPVWLGLIATVLAGGSLYFLLGGEEKANQIMGKVEITLFGEANAASDSTETGSAKNSANAKKGEEHSTDDAKESKTDGKAETTAAKPDAKSWSPEEIALFTKLDERKKQLDAREATLSKLEEELQRQKEELEKRLGELESVRGKIAAKLEDKVKVDQQHVDALVSVYANMKPVQAAKIIEGINDDLAVEVLQKMKNKAAAEILNLMDPEKAKKISERFAGYRQPAAAN